MSVHFSSVPLLIMRLCNNKQTGTHKQCFIETDPIASSRHDAIVTWQSQQTATSRTVTLHVHIQTHTPILCHIRAYTITQSHRHHVPKNYASVIFGITPWNIDWFWWFLTCNIAKKLDINNYSFAQLTLILLLQHLVKCRK